MALETYEDAVIAMMESKNGISDDAHEFFTNRGFKRLDDTVLATSRYVYETPRDTVIKISQYMHGDDYISDNKREVKAWNEYQNETMLAPVVEWHDDYLWIEQQKCRRVWKDCDSIHFAYKKKLHECDIPFFGDLHLDNLGIHPESLEIVCFDYPVLW